MNKKIFALASVSALAGVVSIASVGCKEETIEPPAASPDAGKDVRSDKPIGDEDEPPGPGCKKADATFTPPTINPPKPSENNTGCTTGVIDALADACSKEPESAGCKTARDLAANKACADCLFNNKTDSSWAMITLDPGGTPPARYNQAGCIELASGVKDCGKKYFTVVSCFDAFCGDCTGAEESSCQKDVAQGSGECKQHLIDQTCGNALDSVEKTCFPGEQSDAAIKTLFVNMAKTFCAKGAATDGG